MMALARDLSTLPAAAGRTRGDGWPPDPTPRFAHLLAAAWDEAHLQAGPKPRATQRARFRHSDAGKCARAIAYAALNLPDSDPMDLTGVWNTRLGTLVHDAWQAALQAELGDAVTVEEVVTSLDGDGAGHIDAVIRTDAKVVAYELKTIGGFGFKGAIGAARKGTPAEGPKHEHVVQAALNGAAIDADEVVIGYLGKETLSVNAARTHGRDVLGRFVAEWTLTRDDYEPVAAAEHARVAGILRLLDDGQLPARKIPSPDLPRGAVIVDAKAGRWEQRNTDDQIVDTGSYWGCGYCRYQTMCTGTPADRCSTDVVVELGGAA